MIKKALSAADIFAQFKDSINRADVISARLLSQISLYITKKRLELGLNQSQFAKKMDVSQSMVSKWESENYNYSIESLAKICDKLDLDIDISIQDRNESTSYIKSNTCFFKSSDSSLSSALKSEVDDTVLSKCA